MGRPRSKMCPDCNQFVSSGVLVCDCGGSAINVRPDGPRSRPADPARRTVRTVREKRSFYDSFQVEQQAKEKKYRRLQDQKLVEHPIEKPVTPPPLLAHRMQLTVKKMPEEPEVKEEELEEIILSEEKKAQFSLILNDINRKISAASWKGVC